MRVSNILRSSRVRQVMAVPLVACLFGGAGSDHQRTLGRIHRRHRRQ